MTTLLKGIYFLRFNNTALQYIECKRLASLVSHTPVAVHDDSGAVDHVTGSQVLQQMNRSSLPTVLEITLRLLGNKSWSFFHLYRQEAVILSYYGPWLTS